jgi:hypothetical protein
VNLAFCLRRLFSLILIVGILELIGCGGGVEQPPVRPAPPESVDIGKPVIDQAQEADSSVKSPEEKPSASPVASQSEKPSQPLPKPEPVVQPPSQTAPSPIKKPVAASKRPEDVVKWKKADFLSAHADSDSRLPEAIQHLAMTGEGKPEVAAIVEALLKQSASKNDSFEKISPLLGILGINKTPEAQKIARDLFTGELEIGHDREVVQVVMEILVANPSQENDQVLLNALIDPVKYRALQEGRSAQGNDVSAQELSKRTQTLVMANFTVGVRKKLAQYFIRPDARKEVRTVLLPKLKEPKVANIPAQLLIYESQVPAESEMDKMEKAFASYGFLGIASVMRLYDSKVEEAAEDESLKKRRRLPHNAPGIRLMTLGKSIESLGGNLDTLPLRKQTRPERLAAEVWGPNTSKTVAMRLQKIDSLRTNRSGLIDLARVIPSDRVRAGIFRLCNRCYIDGPSMFRSFSSADLLERKISDRFGQMEGTPKLIIDPGEVVVTKSIIDWQKNPANQPKPKDRKPEDIKKEALKKAKVYEQWLGYLKNLVNDQLRLCSAASVAADPLAEGEEEVCPIPPHEKANIVARLSLKFPKDAEAILGSGQYDPLELHYVRIQELAQPGDLAKYYSRLIKGESDVRSDKKGVWYFNLIDGSRPGTKRSVDVRIMVDPDEANRQVDPDPQPEQQAPKRGRSRKSKSKPKKPVGIPLIVEILTIEINDPSIGKQVQESPSQPTEKAADPK